MRRRGLAGTSLAAAILAVLLLPGSIGAAPGKRVAKASGTGTFYASAFLTTTVRRPRAIWIRIVDGAPATRVDWNLSCSRRFQVEARQGSFRRAGARTKRLPRPIAHAQSCTLIVSAELDRLDAWPEPESERVTVEVRSKRR